MELDKLQARTSILKGIWRSYIYPCLSFMDKQCLLSALNIQPETRFGKYKEEWFNPLLSHEDKEDFIFRLYEICILWNVEPTNINEYDKKQDLDIRAIFLEIVPPKFEYPCLVAFEQIAKLVMKNEKEDIVINYKPCDYYSGMFRQKVPYSVELFQRFGDMGESSIISYIFKTMDIEFYRFLVRKNLLENYGIYGAFESRKNVVEGKTQMEVDQICHEIYTTALLKTRKYHKNPNEVFGMLSRSSGYVPLQVKGGELDINKLTEDLQWLRSCGDYPNSKCSLSLRSFEEIKLYIDCDGVVDSTFLEKISINKCSYECIEYLYSIRKEIRNCKLYRSWDYIIEGLMETCPQNINKAITMMHEMGCEKNGYPFYTLNTNIIPVLVENDFPFPFKRDAHDFIVQLCKQKDIYRDSEVIETLVKYDLIDRKIPLVNSQRVFSL